MPIRDEVLANIREKYPVYKDVPDDELATGISSKYPQYAPILDPNYQARVPNAKTPQQGIATGGSVAGDIANVLPFRNAASEYNAGMHSGEQIGGNGLIGTGLGLALGGARVIADVYNPLGKALGFYTNAAQAGGSTAGGDLNAALQGLSGNVPVKSALEIPSVNTGSVNLDTLINGVNGITNEAAIKQPFSPLALSKGVPSKIDSALKNVAETPSNIKQRVSQRGVFSQPLEAATTEALGVTPIEGSGNIVPVLKGSILEANKGSIPENVAPRELIQQAQDFKINQYLDGLKLAEDQGLAHSTQSLIDAMDSRVSDLHPSFDQGQVDAIVKSVAAEHPSLFNEPYVSPVKGQQIAVQINREVNSKNPNRVPKTSAQLNAETALSQELSRQGSEMYQAATGTYGTPNQDYGVLAQAKEGLVGELTKAQNADAGKNPSGKTIPTTAAGLAVKAVKAVGGRALVPTNQEGVLNSFNRVLNEGSSRLEVSAIDPIQQQGIIDQYTPKSYPNGPINPPIDLESRIQKTIKGLPKNLRGKNERSLAEAIVRSQTAP